MPLFYILLFYQNLTSRIISDKYVAWYTVNLLVNTFYSVPVIREYYKAKFCSCLKKPG